MKNLFLFEGKIKKFLLARKRKGARNFSHVFTYRLYISVPLIMHRHELLEFPHPSISRLIAKVIDIILSKKTLPFLTGNFRLSLASPSFAISSRISKFFAFLNDW